ncbi:MAG: hypothetical protein U0794_04805 [Isosphaeraceae bacterium]
MLPVGYRGEGHGVGGILDHARNFFRGFASPVVPTTQRFSVACPNGHVLGGVRTEGYQALRCPSCGEGIFILPRSPLPEPSDLAPGSGPGRSSRQPEPIDEPVALVDPTLAQQVERLVDDEGVEELEEIEWVDSEPPPRPAQPKAWPDPGQFAVEEIEDAREKSAGAAARENPPKASPSAQSPAQKPAQRPTAPSSLPRPTRGRSDQQRPKRGREPSSEDPYHTRERELEAANASQGTRVQAGLRERLARNRNVLIFSAVGVVVLATVAYRIHRSRLMALPAVVELGWTEGLAALDNGKFDAARQVLSDARDAVDALGDHSERAEAIRQGAREIVILTRLLPDSLEDLLDQASQSDARDWTDRFKRLYAGRTIAVESIVTAVPDSRGSGEYDLAYRIFRPGEGDRPPSVGRLSLKGFELFNTLKPRVGDHVVFGASLAAFQFDLERNEWLVSLEHQSGVTLIHRKALEAIGWPALDQPTEEEQGQP